MKQQLAYLVIVIIAVLLATQVAPAQAGSVTYYFNNSLDGWSMERAELADLPPVMGGLPPEPPITGGVMGGPAPSDERACSGSLGSWTEDTSWLPS